MTMRVALALVLIGLGVGCSGSEEETEVTLAFQTFVNAVQAKDSGRLYDIGPVALRTHVDALYGELSKLLVTVEREYPKAEVASTVAKLGAEFVTGATSGREFFIALVEFSKSANVPGLEKGLVVESIQITGDEALLSTRGGETFALIKEDGKWKCNTLLAQFERNSSFKRLRANMTQVQKNLDAWKKATRETTDLSRPEGVFNVVAQAVRRDARVKIFELLDKTSVAHLVHGVELAKVLRQAVGRKFPRAKQRQSFMVANKVGWVDSVSGAKSLFVALWDSHTFAAEMPLEQEVTIREVIMRPNDMADVIVATEKGEKRFSFIRLPSAQWRLSGLEPVIQRIAVRGLEKALRLIGVNPAAPPK